MVRKLFVLGAAILMAVAPFAFAEEVDEVEEALAEVRGLREAEFSRTSSVIGELASPEECAAMQYRTRPIPAPQPDSARKMEWTRAQREEMAKEFKHQSLKLSGKMPLGITGATVCRPGGLSTRSRGSKPARAILRPPARRSARSRGAPPRRSGA